MHKIAVITLAEIRAFIQTKAFLVSMMFVPLLAIAGPVLSQRLQNADTTPRPFAVLDLTDALYPAIERAAADRTRAIAAGTSSTGQSPYVPSRVVLREGQSIEQLRLELSDRVRRRELFAFVEIPADVTSVTSTTLSKVAYVSDSPTYLALRDWLDRVLAKEVRARRHEGLGLAPDAITRLERPLVLENLGLWRASEEGKPQAAEKVDGKVIIVPMIGSMLLFMLVMITTPTMLQAVIEEKMSRISEVLLGSVTPFELMVGKLLGSTAVAFALGAAYVSAGCYTASRLGYGRLVEPATLGYFAVFLLLALLTYGSLCLAIGAACSDFKEGQNFLMPIIFLGVMPAFMILPAILESPGSRVAVGASLLPTTAPFVMMMRIGLHPSPPGWQIAASVGITLAAAVFSVWAAGRVFRVGLLLQGKGATLRELARWVFVK